ncbi:MAG: PrsW family intramembrane metalloprotease [Anaerolineales bacterium]|nr:PrsW family intramembrane metalloprotease [Anaerolineales bacterium]
MQTKKTHWPSLLTLLIFGISILFLLLIVSVLGISSLIDLFRGSGDAVAEMIRAATNGFEIILLLLCGWFVLQKVMGREHADLPFILPFADWHLLVVIGFAVVGVTVGGLAAYTEIPWLGWLILPVTTLLVIVPPIWLIFGYGSRGLEIGSRWRVFAVLGLGMTIGPVIMVLIELAMLAGIILTGAILLAILEPATFQELMRIAEIVQTETNQEVLLKLMAPYISNPIAITTGIVYIAILVPLIEELLKPLAVWVFAAKIETPAQGFVLGLLSGGAFALIESLNAGADSTVTWPVIVSVRAGTSILHMTASALVGWGIVSAFKEKKIGRLFGAYFSAVLIHGIWNASAAGAGLSAIGESIGKPEWLFNFAPALVCGLLVMGVGMLAVLLASNRKLRNVSRLLTAEESNSKEEEVQLPV